MTQIKTNIITMQEGNFEIGENGSLCRNYKSRITCRSYNKIYTYQIREKADFIRCSIRHNAKEF